MKLVSGFFLIVLTLGFLTMDIHVGLGMKGNPQITGPIGTAASRTDTTLGPTDSSSGETQNYGIASSDTDYGVIAEVKVNSTTYDSTKPTNWVTGVANNLYFNTTTYGWVSQSFDSNRTWGNWIRLTHIGTADSHNYIVGYELKVYDYNTSQWLTSSFIYSTCGNSTPAYWLTDGDIGTSWTHTSNELHEIVVGFSAAIQVSRIELYVSSYDNRSFWQTVRVDVANGWQTVGPGPWLSNSDRNYVWTGSNGTTIGDFAFSQNQYVWTEDRVANAYLELNFTKTLADTNVTLAFYNLNSWTSAVYSTSTVNQWVTMNATLSADWGNQTVMDNFRIRLTSQMSAADALKIEHAYFYWNTSTIASRIQYYLNAPSSVCNWTQNYFGLLFGKVSKTDMANYIDGLANNRQWLDVIRWSVRCQKLGIQETEQIKWALGNITQIGGVLPNTTKWLDGEDAFSVYEREVLYGCFYYATQLNYLTSKWNVGMAYSYFNLAVANNTRPALLMVENNHKPIDGAGRFYDECAETISCYLIFYELKVTSALDGALNTWNWVNSNDWDDTNGHYKYMPSLDNYECEGAFFPRIAAILKYFDWGAGNNSRVSLDVFNRFLVNEWASPQWTQSDGMLAYSVVHMNPGTTERRLANTFGAWSMMLGLYNILNSTAQAKYRNMLLYSGWSKIYHTNTQLYDPTTETFKWLSGGSTDPLASVVAITMQLEQGIVPITTTLAYPLEELHYEYIWDIDPLNLAMDYSSSVLNVSVAGAGTLRFIYGLAPVDYYFPQPGSYQITFANAWTTITNVTRLGDLPLDRKYIGKYQIAFTQTGADLDYVGTILTVDEVNYTLADLPVSFVWDLGSYHTFAYGSPLTVSDNHKQYVWMNTTGLTMLQNGTLNATIFGVITAAYKTQFYLNVLSPYATPSGQGWYDYNVLANATLNVGVVDQGNGTTRVFTGWSGDASGTNFTQSNPIMMNSSKTALANWKDQYFVTFTQSGLGLSASGTVVTVNGTIVTCGMLPYNVWVDSGNTISYAYSNVSSLTLDERFIFVNVTGLPSPMTILEPLTIMGNYKTQYYLTVNSEHANPAPTSGWFDSGVSLTASVVSPDYPLQNDTRFVCTGWIGVGSVPSSGTDLNVSFIITQPSQITWKWKTQYLLGVTVSPSGLDTVPGITPVGENSTVPGYYWYDGGSGVVLTAEPVLGYVFDGWTVDANPYGDGANPVTVVVDGSHVATAVYSARDIAVSDIVPSKTVVDQGYLMTVNVTVANWGHVSETFNVTIYATSTVLLSENVTLLNMSSKVVQATLNSSDFAYGKFQIWAFASPASGEVNTTNNTLIGDFVTVTILGDINGDFKVNLVDLVLLAKAYNHPPGSPGWNPNADINGDGAPNLTDLVILALHYGQHYP